MKAWNNVCESESASTHNFKKQVISSREYLAVTLKHFDVSTISDDQRNFFKGIEYIEGSSMFVPWTMTKKNGET